MTPSEFYALCLTRMCAHVDEWKHPDAVAIQAYRKGNIIRVFGYQIQEDLSADEFRTFMLYRAVWGYGGAPRVLLDALKDPTNYQLIRNGNLSSFDSQQIQESAVFFTVAYAPA